ncbi:diacylglycerol kinase family protein [Candidatus Pacearchaeota archaeon]|jgi:diacylglycerol kinase|nr:diacylglycerol kinase family protein [Candidatus Pacearchaeota archaeon]
MTKISFLQSAICAVKGLYRQISQERNIKIQIILGMFAIFVALILDVSKIYLITIIIVSFLVVILELFNASFERLIDLISPEYNKEFGKVKDAMAGVVLLTFGLAVIVGFLVLYEPAIYIIKNMLQKKFSLAFIIADFFILCIVIIVDHVKRNHQT